jgi:hypothetical protein
MGVIVEGRTGTFTDSNQEHDGSTNSMDTNKKKRAKGFAFCRALADTIDPTFLSFPTNSPFFPPSPDRKPAPGRRARLSPHRASAYPHSEIENQLVEGP